MKPIRSAVLAALLGLAACAAKEEAPAGADAATAVRTVYVAPVGTGDVVESVEVVGELQGIEEVRVYAQVAERLSKLAVREGDLVKEGALLATVVADLQSQGVRQSQAALEAAIANRDAVLDNLARTRKLVEGGAGTAGQLEALEAQARAAQAQVQQATAGAAQASAQRSRTMVRSPISGVVSQIALREGDMASPGAPLLTVVRDERLKAVLRVPEREFLRVREGMPVRLSPLATPEAVLQGEVTVVGPVVDRATRTGLVEVHLDNRERRLRAGTAVRVEIELERQSGVVLAPAEAVLLSPQTERTGRAVVFVAAGDRAERRDVVVGRRQEDSLHVKEGLAAGERLVVRGVHLLRDQSPIKAVAAGAPDAGGEVQQ